MAAERPVGKTKDAGWEIGVSRTLPAPVQAVWQLLTSDEGRALWLGRGALPTDRGAPYETAEGTVGELRSYHDLDRIRLTWRGPGWAHESTVQVAVLAKGPDATMVRFHQERLADAAERERQRAHWSGVLDRIEAALA